MKTKSSYWSLSRKHEDEMERKLKNHWNHQKTSKSHWILFAKAYSVYGTLYKGLHHISWKWEGKMIAQLNYLTMYLNDPHLFFVKANPGSSISFSAFAKLKPKKAFCWKIHCGINVDVKLTKTSFSNWLLWKFVITITFCSSTCVIMYFHQTVGQGNERTFPVAISRLINT